MLSQREHRPGQRLTKGLNVLSWDCGTRNLCYCLIELCDEPDQEFAIRLWENFSLNSDSTAEAVFALQRELDARPWMLHADHVAVEAQSNNNTTMKVISHAIQMYFTCRTRTPEVSRATSEAGTAVEVKGPGKGVSLHFVSPRSKFKCCNVPEPEGVSGHAKNKKVAIMMARKILGSLPDKSMVEYLNSHRKKDDLSDAFLQGLYFLRMIKSKHSMSDRILEHLSSGAELTILPEEEERGSPAASLYQSKNFKLPHFDIDGATVSNSKRFAKGQ